MIGPVVFQVEGSPVAKARARASRDPKTGKTRHYTPEKTRVYENLIAWRAMDAMKGREPMCGPIQIVLTLAFEPPKSWSQKRKRQACLGHIAMTKKPDADNVLKSIKDAMNEIVYKDDAQVVEVNVKKVYAEQAKAFICVKQLPGETAPK